MKQKKIIFRDSEIVDFCKATKDTNEIHVPQFMATIGKRAIVPGMFALSCTCSLSSDFLKTRANRIRVLFNSLLSSGDFVTLKTEETPGIPDEVRLSAINHKDTLTSKDDYTRMYHRDEPLETRQQGILRALPVEPWQVDIFSRLITATDPDVANFLFAVSYASQALLMSIRKPLTEVESEIDTLINGDAKVSPFYQTLEISIPTAFPSFKPGKTLDYFIHLEREKAFKLYTAHVRCENEGEVIFYSRYTLVGIPDMIILRMAKEIRHFSFGYPTH
jgi:hypothetical protein